MLDSKIIRSFLGLVMVVLPLIAIPVVLVAFLQSLTGEIDPEVGRPPTLPQ